MLKPHDPREQDVVGRIRLQAVERIHQAELTRLGDILENYEIERANAKHQVHEACARFGCNHVCEWVMENAKRLGHRL